MVEIGDAGKVLDRTTLMLSDDNAGTSAFGRIIWTRHGHRALVLLCEAYSRASLGYDFEKRRALSSLESSDEIEQAVATSRREFADCEVQRGGACNLACPLSGEGE